MKEKKGLVFWMLACTQYDIKKQGIHVNKYQQFAREDVLYCMFVTLDTTQLLISALNEEVSLKAVAFGRKKKKSKK